VDPRRWGQHDIVADMSDLPSSQTWSRAFGSHCRVNGEACVQNRTVLKVRWPVARISHRLALALYDTLIQRRSKGHHEILTRHLCRVTPCTETRFAPTDMGQYVLGGWGRYMCHDPKDCQLPREVMPNRLYHPVKCARAWM